MQALRCICCVMSAHILASLWLFRSAAYSSYVEAAIFPKNILDSTGPLSRGVSAALVKNRPTERKMVETINGASAHPISLSSRLEFAQETASIAKGTGPRTDSLLSADEIQLICLSKSHFKWSKSPIHLQRADESFLRYINFSKLPHFLFTRLLLIKQLPLPRRVPAVAFRCHILAHG